MFDVVAERLDILAEVLFFVFMLLVFFASFSSGYIYGMRDERKRVADARERRAAKRRKMLAETKKPEPRQYGEIYVASESIPMASQSTQLALVRRNRV